MIGRLLRDPLAHFLLGGAILWALLGLAGEPADPAARAIAVSRARQAALADNYAQLMGRRPTERELAGLIESDVREEVLYREALRLGFDQDDPVVRRRLATKMAEAASAGAEAAEPSDAELRGWLATHPQRFAGDAVLRFSQRLFASEAQARAALAVLRRGQDAGGDGGALPVTVGGLPERELRERLGRQFAAGLARLNPGGGWQGPIPSGYGWHAVRLDPRLPGAVPPFETIRPRVLADWRGATMLARQEAAYRALRDRYRVTVAR